MNKNRLNRVVVIIFLILMTLTGFSSNVLAKVAEETDDIALIFPVEQTGKQWIISQGYNTSFHGNNDNNRADLMTLDITERFEDSFGKNVIAASEGEVWYLNESHKNCGVVLKHGHLFTTYFHVNPADNLVIGQPVSTGEIIGTIGHCGGVRYGAHVHFMLNKWVGAGDAPHTIPFRSHWEAVPFLNICGESFPFQPDVRNQYNGTPITSCVSSTTPVQSLEIGDFIYSTGEGHPYTVSPLVLNSDDAWGIGRGDVGQVIGGPMILDDNSTWYQIKWLGGFYDEKDMPVHEQSPYPDTSIGWVQPTQVARLQNYHPDVAADNVFLGFIGMMYTTGTLPYETGLYEPDSFVERGWLAWVIYTAAGLEQETSCGDFADVPPTHPYYEAITTLKCRDIITGFSDELFHPDEFVTREQLAKFIANTLVALEGVADAKSCAAGVPQFIDVDENHLFYDFIHCVRGLGISTGYSDDTFRPEDLVTKGQLAKFMMSGRSITYYARQDGMLELTITPVFDGSPRVGDYVLFSINILRAQDLHAVELLSCGGGAYDFLAGEAEFGDFFNPDTSNTSIRKQRYVIDAKAEVAGRYPSINGDSVDNFLLISFKARNPGNSFISCDAHFYNANGDEISAYVNNSDWIEIR